LQTSNGARLLTGRDFTQNHSNILENVGINSYEVIYKHYANVLWGLAS